MTQSDPGASPASSPAYKQDKGSAAHSLSCVRHSHATQLLADGVHPKIAQERLGHSTITTTMDLYSHVTDTMQTDAAARLDAAFRPAITGRVAK